MKGLELARRYYWEVGRPAVEARCPEALPHLAAGLAGEGSDCLGFDDALSRDHDWGPGFCLWLTEEAFDRFGAALCGIYASLPALWQGYERLRPDPLSAGRVGVVRIGDFYERFLGLRTPPATAGEWLNLSDEALCLCTDGEVFEDGPGLFSAFRRELLAYYPEDIRLKRLAARCAGAARAGQYQLPRCLRRGDRVAAFRALADFLDHAEAAVFLLERQYRPYYKWSHQAMKRLPGAGDAVPLFETLAGCRAEDAPPAVEALCSLLIRMLREAGLSDASGDFLLDHAKAVQAAVQSDGIRNLPLFSFP